MSRQAVASYSYSVETHKPGVMRESIQADIEEIKTRLVQRAKAQDDVDWDSIK